MANTLLDQYELANNDEFQGRVTIAALNAAVAVMAEDNPTPERTELAGRILRNPTGMAQTMALAVVTNPAVHEGSGDSDLEWTIASVFDAMATAQALASSRARVTTMKDVG